MSTILPKRCIGMDEPIGCNYSFSCDNNNDGATNETCLDLMPIISEDAAVFSKN
jgi:hypothetical protein